MDSQTTGSTAHATNLNHPVSRLIIKFPTRNRPDKARARLDAMIARLSGDHEVRFVVTCDRNDPTMNNPDMRDWFLRLRERVDLKVTFGTSRTKIQAVNADLSGESADALLLASDDMNPVADGFDALLFDHFARAFPDFRGALRFPDGLREDDLMTYPVLGWPLFQAFGYIFHPWYRSLYCDNELTDSCKALGVFSCSETPLFHHEWTWGPWDRLARRNENRWMYLIDGKIYTLRKRLGYDIRRVRKNLKQT